MNRDARGGSHLENMPQPLFAGSGEPGDAFRAKLMESILNATPHPDSAFDDDQKLRFNYIISYADWDRWGPGFVKALRRYGIASVKVETRNARASSPPWNRLKYLVVSSLLGNVLALDLAELFKSRTPDISPGDLTRVIPHDLLTTLQEIIVVGSDISNEAVEYLNPFGVRLEHAVDSRLIYSMLLRDRVLSSKHAKDVNGLPYQAQSIFGVSLALWPAGRLDFFSRFGALPFTRTPWFKTMSMKDWNHPRAEETHAYLYAGVTTAIAIVSTYLDNVVSTNPVTRTASNHARAAEVIRSVLDPVTLATDGTGRQCLKGDLPDYINPIHLSFDIIARRSTPAELPGDNNVATTNEEGATDNGQRVGNLAERAPDDEVVLFVRDVDFVLPAAAPQSPPDASASSDSSSDSSSSSSESSSDSSSDSSDSDNDSEAIEEITHEVTPANSPPRRPAVTGLTPLRTHKSVVSNPLKGKTPKVRGRIVNRFNIRSNKDKNEELVEQYRTISNNSYVLRFNQIFKPRQWF